MNNAQINKGEIDNVKRGRRWKEGVSLPSDYKTVFLHNKQQNDSVTDKVYYELRHLILNDIIPPGSWLRQDELTSQLGVSKTPVREALRSLHRQGMIEFVPNYGARVPNLSIEEFEEIYSFRKGIEGLAARRGVQKLSFEKLNTLRSKYDALIPLAENSSLSEYLMEEWNFRYWLYKVGERKQSPFLLLQIRELRERAERYLRYAYTIEGATKVSLEFHHELLLACDNGDPASAEVVVQKALNWTLEKAGPIIENRLRKLD